MRRICRFSPWVRMMRNRSRPTRVTLQGLVITPMIFTPLASMLSDKIRDRAIHRDQVFLLVLVLGAQDLVDDVAVVGQEDQAFGVLVQASDGKDPLADAR